MIVERALGLAPKRVLITTYTTENLEQIRDFFLVKYGCIPAHITVLSWFSFLLQDGVRPYQSSVTSAHRRANSIHFEELQEWNRRIPKAKSDIYFLTKSDDVYRDRVSELVCACDDASGNLVVKRLEKVYDAICVDEVQDMAGYDLTLLEKLFNSSIDITVMGDPRQGTYSTNNSAKNKQFKRAGMIDWFEELQKLDRLQIIEKNECHRCNQQICDFADALFPEYEKTKSLNNQVTAHDGIFEIKASDVAAYIGTHCPVILRWNKASNTMGLPAINFGASKGRTYDRVLIFPTKPMVDYVQNRDVTKLKDPSKFYVAVTRARFSVAFVLGL